MANFLQRITNIKNKENLSKIDITKGKIITFISFFSAMMVIPVVIGMLILKVWIFAVICAFVSCVSFLSYYLAKKGKISIAALVMLIPFYALFIFIAFMTSGINSHIMFAYFLLVVSSVYFMDIKKAILINIPLAASIIIDVLLKLSSLDNWGMQPDIFSYFKVFTLLFSLTGVAAYFLFVVSSQKKMYQEQLADMEKKMNILMDIKQASQVVETLSENTETRVKESISKIVKVNELSMAINGLLGEHKESSNETLKKIDLMSKSISSIDDEIEQQRINTQDDLIRVKDLIKDIQHINKVTFDMIESSIALKEFISSSVNLVSESHKSLSKLLATENDIFNFGEKLNSITENINILAINANIEAANAGVSGTGFRVVANEVRNLAAESQSSIETMKKHLEHLKYGIEDVNDKFNMIDNAFANVERHNENTNNIIKEVHDMATNQAASSQQLKSSMELLEKNSQMISNFSQSITIEMENIKKIAKSLSEGSDYILSEYRKQYEQIASLNCNLEKLKKAFLDTQTELQNLFGNISDIVS